MERKDHTISIPEGETSNVERKEDCETSRGHDQFVIGTDANHSTTNEKVFSLEDGLMKLKEAGVKTETPKIGKVVCYLREHEKLKKHYKPMVVSLGPIHHCNTRYKEAEKFKLRLANEFIEKSGESDEELYNKVVKNIRRLREYYDQEVTKKYDDKNLAWMLFVDGCAILQFIYSDVHKEFQELKIKKDQVFFVNRDLFLLENQLPYQLLIHLINSSENRRDQLKESIEKFIDKKSTIKKDEKNANAENVPIHLLDKLRTRLISCSRTQSENEPIHLLDKLWTRLISCCSTLSPNPNRNARKNKRPSWTGKNKWRSFRNVQELRAVGIQLKPSDSSSLKDISFTKKRNFYPGILSLPPITVDDSTGPKFLNLIAYEMSLDFKNDYDVTTYISFIDSLIDEPNDVMKLRKARILQNCLGSDEQVCQFFNEISTDLVPNTKLYRDVEIEIQKYYDNKVMTWISQFYHSHFSTPWTLLAFIGALLALSLSAVQTVYTIK